MGLTKRGNIWWYRFNFEGRAIQESTKTSNKELARRIEETRRRELIEGVTGVTSARKERARLMKTLTAEYERDYKLKHEVTRFVTYAVMHLDQHLGKKTLGEIDVRAVSGYQATRKEEGASNNTINKEVGVLLRVMEERGDVLRAELGRKKKLNLKVDEHPGKQYAVLEQDRMSAATATSRSPHIAFALQLALNSGMRDKEMRQLTWGLIDFSPKDAELRIGKSKTKGSSHRAVPLNADLLAAFLKHREWYIKQFFETRPEWYVFPFGPRGYMDPTKHVTTLKTAWKAVREKAGVEGRWHDHRHTVVSQLAEMGEGEETIMSIAGHVARSMLKHYSHIGKVARRRALENMRAYRDQKREDELAAVQQFEDKDDTKSVTVN